MASVLTAAQLEDWTPIVPDADSTDNEEWATDHRYDTLGLMLSGWLLAPVSAHLGWANVPERKPMERLATKIQVPIADHVAPYYLSANVTKSRKGWTGRRGVRLSPITHHAKAMHLSVELAFPGAGRIHAGDTWEDWILDEPVGEDSIAVLVAVRGSFSQMLKRCFDDFDEELIGDQLDALNVFLHHISGMDDLVPAGSEGPVMNLDTGEDVSWRLRLPDVRRRTANWRACGVEQVLCRIGVSLVPLWQSIAHGTPP